MSVTATVNRKLKALGRAERLTRGNGYYYVAGVAVSSGLYVYSLTEPGDLQLALDHVAEVLSNEDSKPFTWS